MSTAHVLKLFAQHPLAALEHASHYAQFVPLFLRELRKSLALRVVWGVIGGLVLFSSFLFLGMAAMLAILHWDSATFSMLAAVFAIPLLLATLGIVLVVGARHTRVTHPVQEALKTQWSQDMAWLHGLFNDKQGARS